jgi:hypothetical protein
MVKEQQLMMKETRSIVLIVAEPEKLNVRIVMVQEDKIVKTAMVEVKLVVMNVNL